MANILPNTVMSPHLFKKVAVPNIYVEWTSFLCTLLRPHNEYSKCT
jgi:hypothetical protein